MECIVVYVTHASQEDAQKLSTYLLEKKYIACANIFPIASSYFWDGSMNTDDEYVSLLKTRAENWDLLQNEIEMQHPYTTPCIMKFAVEVNSTYLEWIYQETKR